MGLSNRIPAEGGSGTVQVLGASIPVLQARRPDPGTRSSGPSRCRSFLRRTARPRSSRWRSSDQCPGLRATADGTLLVAQVDSAEAAALAVGDRVRVQIDPTPILVVAS